MDNEKRQFKEYVDSRDGLEQLSEDEKKALAEMAKDTGDKE